MTDTTTTPQPPIRTRALAAVVAAMDHADAMHAADGADRPRVTEHDYPQRAAALRAEAGQHGDHSLVSDIDVAPPAPDYAEIAAARAVTERLAADPGLLYAEPVPRVPTD